MGVKSVLSYSVVGHVAQGDDRHPLVMGHVRTNHGHLSPFRQPRRGVVECFVEAVVASGSGLLETGQVLHGGSRFHHGREGGGVGSHDHVFAQAALEPQSGHAETRVLIGELHVADVVGRFRDPPRDSSLRAVTDLAPHDEPAGEVKKALGGLPHHDKRHQVFEHGPRPGDEGRTASHRCESPAEEKPVPR